MGIVEETDKNVEFATKIDKDGEEYKEIDENLAKPVDIYENTGQDKMLRALEIKEDEKTVEDLKLVPREVLKQLDFSFDVHKAKFEIDVLQNKLLEFYLRADMRFKKAYVTDFTPYFVQFLKDRARLKEPLNLSIIGVTRSGKSSIAISICVIHSLLNGRIFTADYICANSYEFLEKIQNMPSEMLMNSIFLIDEDKQPLGVGSLAKKLKLQDVSNIIAVNNISTVSLNPQKWASASSDYGLKTFGRCFNTKVVRLMLYNLQEKGTGGELPLGMLYFKIFNNLLPKEYSDILERDYLRRKNAWVENEMRGENDILAELQKKMAERFVKDANYLKIKHKTERITYISQVLGSEWASSEIKVIESLTKLLSQGLIE